MSNFVKQNWWPKYKTHFFICLTIISCFISYFLENNGWCFLSNVFSGIALSVLAGLILGYYIDIPNMEKNYKNAMLNILTSDEYLKELDPSRLAKLREATTAILYSIPNNYEPGLILLDKEICSLLTHPYYEWYRQNITCEIDPKYNCIKKHIELEYRIKSPNYDIDKTYNEDIGVRIFTHTVPGIELNELLEINKIAYKIDEEEWRYLTSRDIAIFQENCQNKTDNVYPYCLTTSYESGNLKQINKSFKRCMEVKISYNKITINSDKTFCKRLRHPAKSFILNYSVKDVNQKLHGELLGTLVDISDYSIIGNETNSIFIESRKWMLPKNGAVIILQ